MNNRKRQTTVRLPDYMLADLNAEAQRQGISVSRLIEDRLEEARSGVEMEELSHYDIEHFEEYVARL